MKQALLFCFCLIAIVIFSFDKFNKTEVEVTEKTSLSETPVKDYNELRKKATLSKQFCIAKKFNTNICFLIDYKLHSGLPRFFVWDFKNNKTIDSGLVSHGCATNTWGKDESKTNPMFSNQLESHCSSLGKYLIKERGFSQWGIHVKYNLKGLETTNSNALQRFIVLHSWEAIKDNAVYPLGTPEGWGCPAVSNNFMKKLDNILQKETNKKVLLWVYN